MKQMSLTCMVLLAIALLNCGDAHAQARNQASRSQRDHVQKAAIPDTDARSRKREELENWLRRLVGGFQLKGSVVEYLNDGRPRSQNMDGVMHCSGIGDGPGVHCVVKASFGTNLWLSFGGRGGGTLTPSITYNTLNPAVMLFALDPDDLKIKVLLVDDHSIAEDLSGVLAGDAVDLVSGRRGCWGPVNLVHCPWALRITAKADSDVIKVRTTWKSGGIQIEFSLRREADGVPVSLP